MLITQHAMIAQQGGLGEQKGFISRWAAPLAKQGDSMRRQDRKTHSLVKSAISNLAQHQQLRARIKSQHAPMELLQKLRTSRAQSAIRGDLRARKVSVNAHPVGQVNTAWPIAQAVFAVLQDEPTLSRACLLSTRAFSASPERTPLPTKHSRRGHRQSGP